MQSGKKQNKALNYLSNSDKRSRGAKCHRHAAFASIIRKNQLIEEAKNPFQTARAQRLLGRIEKIAMRPFEVELQEKANAVSPAPLTSNGVNSVSICHQNLPGVFRRAIADASAYARMPLSRLLQAPQVANGRGRCHRGHGPVLFFIERQ